MKLVLVLGRQMLLSVFVVHVRESDAAMSAPSVPVYTEQRTREMREHRARKQGRVGSKGPGQRARY